MEKIKLIIKKSKYTLKVNPIVKKKTLCFTIVWKVTTC